MKNEYRNVSIGLKFVLTPSWIFRHVMVSKKLKLLKHVSAVNLIVEWCLVACSMNWLTMYLLGCSREIISLM